MKSTKFSMILVTKLCSGRSWLIVRLTNPTLMKQTSSQTVVSLPKINFLLFTLFYLPKITISLQKSVFLHFTSAVQDMVNINFSFMDWIRRPCDLANSLCRCCFLEDFRRSLLKIYFSTTYAPVRPWKIVSKNSALVIFPQIYFKVNFKPCKAAFLM